MVTSYFCNGVVLSIFHKGGGPRVYEVPGLVTSFYCNGVVLSTEFTEEIVYFGQGGGPGVCKALALVTYIAVMEQSLVSEFVWCYVCFLFSLQWSVFFTEEIVPNFG